MVLIYQMKQALTVIGYDGREPSCIERNGLSSKHARIPNARYTLVGEHEGSILADLGLERLLKPFDVRNPYLKLFNELEKFEQEW